MLSILPSNRYNLPHGLRGTADVRKKFEESILDGKFQGGRLGYKVASWILIPCSFVMGRNVPAARPGFTPPYRAPGTFATFCDEGIVGFAVDMAHKAIAEAGAMLGVIVGTAPYAIGAMRGTNNGNIISTYADYGKQAGLLAALVAGLPAAICLPLLRHLASEAIYRTTGATGTMAGALIGAGIGIVKAPAQAFKAPVQSA